MALASSAILDAVLLLGPTGAGKSPLGDWLQAHGLWGRPCHHFDFGANLRAVATGTVPDPFTPEEVRFVQRVLAEGALLENETFCLAAKILEAFIARRGIRPEHWLVLNGLPRQVGQAQALARRLAVRAVVQLECDARVIAERLARDPAGDRAARDDDHAGLVARKLAVYRERTRPLVEYYRERGSKVIVIAVGAETLPADVARQLEAR
jgi:adenylate kinase family enzyme